MLAPLMGGDRHEAEDSKTHDSFTVYLISSDFFGPDEVIEYLKKNYMPIFHNEIEGWITDPALWPEKVTWKQFQSWFKVCFHSMVFDMDGEDEIYEEL